MASESHTVKITQKANEDFIVALAYYGRVAGKASAARFVARYEEILDYLEAVPTATAKVGDTGYRWLPIASHVLVFKVDEQASVVHVVRIVYGTSNWRNDLENGRM